MVLYHHMEDILDSNTLVKIDKKLTQGLWHHLNKRYMDSVAVCKFQRLSILWRSTKIFLVNYRSLQMFLLDVKWFKVVTQGINPIVQ